MQRITPCLWFNGDAEEAANFYVSIFSNSRIDAITHFPKGFPRAAGSVMTVGFVLDGQEFVALNGGPLFKFTPAISLVVNCETQVELDEYWRKLAAGGEEVRSGWLKDKFGVSWQVVPLRLIEILRQGSPTASMRTMLAMLPMKKLDIASLEQAYNNG